MNSCKKNWAQNGDHCYYWSLSKANWAKAEKGCNYCKGHLASVTSEAKNKFILSELRKQNTTRPIWLGGSDKEKQGIWKWTDQSTWSFENWAENQTNKNCLSYSSTVITPTKNIQSKWKARDCNERLQYVCSVRLCSGTEEISLSCILFCISIS